MNYILNTKTKTVEIFWKDEEEYKAIMELLMSLKITEPEYRVGELLQPSYTNISGFGGILDTNRIISCNDTEGITNTKPDNAVLMKY